MSVATRQQDLIDNYAVIENRQERLGAIVDTARRLPPLAESERVPANLVGGCISRVWLVGDCPAGACHFRADCDSPMVKGLVALLCESYDGESPADVVATPPTVLESLGVTRDLTPTRQNGLTAVRQRMVDLARSWL